MNPRLRLWLICISFAIGAGIPNIADMFYPNTAQDPMEDYLGQELFNISILGSREGKDEIPSKLSLVWSVFVDTFAIGLLLSAFPVAALCDKLGRRKTILWSLVLAVPGHFLQVVGGKVPKAWILLFIGRFIAMFNHGLYQVTCPIFINEISPEEIRGKLGTTQPIALTLGTLLGVGLGLEELLGTPSRWPYAYVIFGVLGMLAIPFVAFAPDSPSYIAASTSGPYREEKVRSALEYYHGNSEKLEQIMRDVGKTRTGSTSLLRVLYRLMAKKILRRPLLIATALSIAYSAIFVMNSYSTVMLESAGVEEKTAAYLTVSMKALSFLVFVVAMFTVDKVGRRPLLLVSLFGSSVTWTLMTIFQVTLKGQAAAIACIVTLFGAQIFMNIGVRALYFVVVPEVFPYQFRALGKVFSVTILYVYMVVSLFGFLPQLRVIGGYAYFLLFIPLWASSIYFAIVFPETKRKQPWEIFPELAALNPENMRQEAPPAPETQAPEESYHSIQTTLASSDNSWAVPVPDLVENMGMNSVAPTNDVPMQSTNSFSRGVFEDLRVRL